VLLTFSGCTKPQAKSKQQNSKKKQAPPPSARIGTHVLRSLLREASRAELGSRGLFINLGTPDQHKYIVGGWQTGWGERGSRGGLYLQALQRARLVLHDWAGGASAVVVRARSAHKKQKVTLYVDDRAISSARVPPEWEELVFELPSPLKPGHRTLTLAFTRSRRGKASADVDWVWLRDEASAPRPNPKKSATLTFGTPRRALVADPPRTLSFYLEVPEQSALVFDYAGQGKPRFEVRVSKHGAAPATLFSGEGGPRWREGRVDLSGLAGELVRLDLVSRGGAGGRAGWGEPELLRKGRAPQVRPVGRDQRAKNLLYILIDTVRQDVFRGFNPKTRVEAPAMDRLARESSIFTNAYANSNWTKPSVATIWSGLYPSTHNTKTKPARLPREVPVYSEHLRKHGFATAAFIANGYTSGKFGFKRGWDHYRNYIREDKPYKAVHVYADALAWLKRNRDKRFFLYIQSIDPHVPYEAPRPFLSRYHEGEYKGRLGPTVTGYETQDFNEGKVPFSEEDRQYTRAHYDGEVTYHDHHFGLFLEQVRRMGLLDETLLVVSNDHGEELLDHGKYGHGHTLYEELIRAPLVIRYPPLFPAGGVYDEVVELVDLLPTELQVLGLPWLNGIEGLSLLGLVQGRPAMVPGYAISEYRQLGRAVRLGTYKLIRWRSGKTELYDLARDPGEQENVAASHPVARRACEVYLGEGLGVPGKGLRLNRMPRRRRFDGGEARIDPDLRRQLNALGYIN
jgi:arylsulfatase A-like enzyme